MRTRAFFIGGLLATTALVSPALAQDAKSPPREFVDQNGVNLASGTMVLNERLW